MEEVKDGSNEKQLSEAISQKRQMTELLEDKNFKTYVAILQAQIDGRIHQMLVMPEGMDDAVKRIYAAGEIAGFKVALNLPQLMIDGAQGTIDILKPFINKESE